jgi:hypothetical protein
MLFSKIISFFTLVAATSATTGKLTNPTQNKRTLN